MSKKLRPGLSRQTLELSKAFEILQHELLNLGVTLVVPRRLRLKLRGDEPEVFPSHSSSRSAEDARAAAQLVDCKEWTYLDRLL